MSESVWSFQRNEEVWARRRHPLSFWMRLAVLPLLGATLWIRSIFDPGFLVLLVLLIVVAWASERIFPAPDDTKAWAVRASEGERLFSQGLPPFDSSRGLVRALTVIGSLGTLIMVSGSILFDLTTTIVGVIVMLGGKLVAFDRMARAVDVRNGA